MKIGKSSNPVLSEKRFKKIQAEAVNSTELMTINGTLNKTILLFTLLLISGFFAWKAVASGAASHGLLIFGLVGGLILAFATIFKPHWAQYTAPAYAIVEGILVGAVSALYESMYDGIVLKAVGLTLSILFIMLVLYRSGTLKATPKFKKGVIIAGGGVLLFYLLNITASLFGGGFSLGNLGPIGILIQLGIVGIASMFLILDFDSIENGAKAGLPKYMEWYSGFGIMLTLIWLYFEVLRLLSFISGD